MRSFFSKVFGHLRATRRLILALLAVPALLGLVALQALIAKPLFKNNTALPKAFSKIVRKLVGIKVVFNKNAAPIVNDKPVWFVANHLTTIDPFVLSGNIEGTFIGKGEIMKWPVAAQVVRAANMIPVRRDPAFNPKARGQIIANFNKGHNTIMFPEGTTSPTREVNLFRAGLLTLLYGEKAVDKKDRPVALQEDVVVQPVAIRVLEVEGKCAIKNDDLRDAYTMGTRQGITSIWKRLMVKNITVELTPLEPLAPKSFDNAVELVNQAALEVASVVNPGQTEFEKAKIPGKEKKKQSIFAR